MRMAARRERSTRGRLARAGSLIIVSEEAYSYS